MHIYVGLYSYICDIYTIVYVYVCIQAYICVYVYVYMCVYTCDVYTWWALRRCWLLLWLTGVLWSLNERIHKLCNLWAVHIWTAIVIFLGLLRPVKPGPSLAPEDCDKGECESENEWQERVAELFSLPRASSDGWNQIRRESPSWCTGCGSPSKHPPLCTLTQPPLWPVTTASPAQKPGQRK